MTRHCGVAVVEDEMWLSPVAVRAALQCADVAMATASVCTSVTAAD